MIVPLAALAMAAAGPCGLAKTDFRNFDFKIPFRVDWEPARRYVEFEDAKFADIGGDTAKERIVTVRFSLGGAWSAHVIYVFGCEAGRLAQLTHLETGDRAMGGLRRLAVKKGMLVVETFDGDRAQGLCCSDGIIRRRYRLEGSVLRQHGPDERKRVRFAR